MSAKVPLVTVVAALLCSVSGGSQIFWDQGPTGLDFQDFERLAIDLNGNGRLDVGDTLRGVLRVQDTTKGINGSVVIANLLPGNLAGNPSILGVYELMVLAKFADPVAGYNYVLGPYAPFGAEVGVPNAMIACYSIPAAMAGQYDTLIEDTTKTSTDVENFVKSGTPLFSAGLSSSRLAFTPPFGSTQPGDGYWYATQASELVGSGFGTANFYYGLNIAPGFGIGPSNFVPITNYMQLFPALSSDLNTFVGRGSATPNTPQTGSSLGSQQKYPVLSNDPAGVYYVVPEPATSGMACIFLLGLAAAIWRKSRTTR